MATDPNCLFCKIVAGELPCFRLYEDDLTLAFMDINPFNDGHALAIPKAHHVDVGDVPPEIAGAAMAAAVRVARAVEKVVSPDGINLVQANGPGAGQTVFHFHVHVFPRRNGDDARLNWGHRPGDLDRIRAFGEKIAAAIG